MLLIGPAIADSPKFNRDILPLLSDNCFQCHGPDDKHRKADLRLNQKEGLFASTQEGNIVTPGSPRQSLLFQRITASDPDDRMPPQETKKSLSPQEIELLGQWIKQGASWQGHWAFIPPLYPEIPSVQRPSWPNNPIDFFILNRLEQAGLRPSPEADRRTLIRRLSLDLTGLPPEPGEVENFVRDSSPNAYEKVVDRLLSSIRYAERMALAWMDAARYGDSSVYHADGPRFMWPWRDWVIDAYAGNKPFDQFTMEQLAGDLLPHPTPQQLVATGFNRNHGTTDEGGAIDEEYRVEYVVDRVKTTSRVWLGLTMECGQCHDHKYDPISQKEYYAFYAYFNQTKDKGMQTRNGNEPPIVELPTPEQERNLASLASSIQEKQEQRTALQPDADLLATWIVQQEKALQFDPPQLSTWHKLGPFESENADQAFQKDFGPETEASIDLSSSFDGKSWEKADHSDREAVNLDLPENSALYLHRTLTSASAQSVALSLGSDDGIKVWLNGKELLANNARRGVAADQESVTLPLVQGENHFLLKINNAGGGSGFYFHIRGSGLPEEIIEVVRIARDQRTDDQTAQLEAYYLQNVSPQGLALDEEIQDLQKKRRQVQDAVVTCMIMQDMEDPRKTYVLNRGHYASPITNEVIEPNVPSVLPPLPEDAPSNRLALARWLVDPQHPLTARVTVNRYWTMLFGTGLVDTVADFGTRGSWPSHPNLLDWLARDFIDNGWDIKRTLKQIVMSATYRQSSRTTSEHMEKDPENRLLSRAPRLRLQAEFVRDNALAISGLLNGKVGGPSTKPYQPPNIWNEVSLDGNLRYERDSGEELYRRGMYIYWKRSAPMPSMMAFDAPTREKCLIDRQRTNTPLQALVTLNDVQFVESARLFARRILAEGGDTFRSRLDRAFLIATARPADELRHRVLRGFFEEQKQRFEASPRQAEELLGFGEHPSAERIPMAEQAAWTLVANAILNLDEVLVRE